MATDKTADGPKNAPEQDASFPTSTQIMLGVMIVGASAGLTLYTRRTASWMSQMKQVEKNHEMRVSQFRKFGPPTRAEWEKLRPRPDKDDD